MPVFGAKHDVVIDVVGAVVRFPFHGSIIPREQMFGYILSPIGRCLFHPTPQGGGFSEAVSIKFSVMLLSNTRLEFHHLSGITDHDQKHFKFFHGP